MLRGKDTKAAVFGLATWMALSMVAAGCGSDQTLDHPVELPDAPVAVGTDPAVVATGEFVFVLSDGDLSVLNLGTKSWQVGKRFPGSATHEQVMAPVGHGQVFVWGGSTWEDEPSSNGYLYDRASDTWTETMPSAEGWSGASGYFSDGRVVIGGGSSNGEHSSQLATYDLDNDSWTYQEVGRPYTAWVPAGPERAFFATTERDSGQLAVFSLDRATGEQEWLVPIETAASEGSEYLGLSLTAAGVMVVESNRDVGSVTLLSRDGTVLDRYEFDQDLVSPTVGVDYANRGNDFDLAGSLMISVGERYVSVFDGDGREAALVMEVACKDRAAVVQVSIDEFVRVGGFPCFGGAIEASSPNLVELLVVEQ